MALIYINSLDIPQRVVDKIWQKHGVTAEEVDEVLIDNLPFRIKLKVGLYSVCGQTIAGRYLFIVIRKISKKASYTVITARDMKERDKQKYKKYHR